MFSDDELVSYGLVCCLISQVVIISSVDGIAFNDQSNAESIANASSEPSFLM